MKKNFIILLFCLLPAVCSFADKKMTVRNIDTGESFEVEVPDGMKISIEEYNSEWLDSIPYLVEQARWKEPWAFEALADCYRYGKGGVEKSLFNAIACYEESHKAVGEIAEEAYENDPTDELGLLDHIMKGLHDKSMSEDDVIKSIDGMKTQKPNWLVFLADILRQGHDSRHEYIESRLTPDLSRDEALVGLTIMTMDDPNFYDNTFVGVADDNLQKISFFGARLPLIYEIAAEKMMKKYYENVQDKDKYLYAALDYMHHADQYGFLSENNMKSVLKYCEKNGIDGHVPFSEDDLARFEAIISR